MKNPDEAIDKVLGGLREVEAPAGMERRVLAAMETRSAARSGWRPAMGWVLACGVAAGFVAGVLMMRPSRGPVEKIAVVAIHAPVAVPVRVEQVQKRNTGVQTVTAPLNGPIHPAGVAAFHFAQNYVHFSQERKAEQVRPVEVAAVAKVEEERGFPAPPMPLTEEEKLLLRIAHRVDPQELTPLNAEARARQEAEFDEEFMEFFAAPEPVTEENQTNPTESEKGETR
jgi:hypothetical protein